MNEIRNILIGFELGKEMSQFCYYDRKAQDPISIPMKVGTSEYEFPTQLCKKKGEDQWRFGMESNYFATQSDWILVEDLYTLCQQSETFFLDGKNYEPGELLGEFLREALKMLGIADPVEHITGIMVTVRELTRNMVLNIRKACLHAGFEKEQFFIQDFNESFYYHTFYQRPEIWNRKVALFDFYQDQVTYKDLMLHPKSSPMSVVLTQGKTIDLSVMPMERDEQFCQLIRESFGSHIYSGVFLVGDGFDTEWAQKAVPQLCRNQRKVFHGNNLFAKGACYGAKEKVEEHQLKGYLYEGQDLIRTNIGMEMLIQGTNAYYPLIMAGVNWYEAEKDFELILNKTEELVFMVNNLENQSRSNYGMKLDNLPHRPEKTTRIQVHMEFESPHLCRITAKDLGFGELYPASKKEWTEILEV